MSHGYLGTLEAPNNGQQWPAPIFRTVILQPSQQLRRPGFLYQPRLEFLAVKALPSLIDGPEADSRDSTENLWHLRFQKVLRPDIWHFPASEEPVKGGV